MRRFNDNSSDEENGSFIHRTRLSRVFKLSKLTHRSDTDINHQIVMRTNHSNSSKSDAIKMLFVIATTFLLLNFPLAFIKTYQYFRNKKSSPLMGLKYENATQYFNRSYHIKKSNNMSSDEFIEQIFDFENNTMKFNLTDLVLYSKQFQIQEILSKLSYFVYYINFSINFFLYSFKKKQFRNSILKFFK